MIPIKIKLVEDGQLPKKAHASDACYDLYCRKIEHVGPGKVICHLGIKTEIPEGYKAIIVPRSSSSHKGWILANLTGVVDAGFRQEWMTKWQAIPQLEPEQDDPFGGGCIIPGYWYFPDFPYEEGDRCAQFSIEKVLETELVVVEEELEESERKGGWGSTQNK